MVKACGIFADLVCLVKTQANNVVYLREPFYLYNEIVRVTVIT